MSSQIDSPQWIHKTCKVLYNSALNFQKYGAKFTKKCHRDRLRKRKRLWLRCQRNPALMKNAKWSACHERGTKKKSECPTGSEPMTCPTPCGRSIHLSYGELDTCPAYSHCMEKEWKMVNFKLGETNVKTKWSVCHERGTKKKSESVSRVRILSGTLLFLCSTFVTCCLFRLHICFTELKIYHISFFHPCISFDSVLTFV